VRNLPHPAIGTLAAVELGEKIGGGAERRCTDHGSLAHVNYHKVSECNEIDISSTLLKLMALAKFSPAELRSPDSPILKSIQTPPLSSSCILKCSNPANHQFCFPNPHAYIAAQ
jgi:hypothetical protein